MMLRHSRQVLRVMPKRFNSSVAHPEPTFPAPKNVSDLSSATAEDKKQAPNRAATWAPSQQPRAEAMSGPRFEQRDLERQPRPYAAIELIAQQPIRYLNARSAVCDGGKGAQGHPRIYINLDKPEAQSCLYCGLRYASEDFKKEIEAAASK